MDQGPWGSRSGSPTPAVDRAVAASPAPASPPLDKGQHPVWAAVSTLLLAGFIWYFTGSWVIAGAVIWGLLVHEYGHVLAMNRYGMGPARIAMSRHDIPDIRLLYDSDVRFLEQFAR